MTRTILVVADASFLRTAIADLLSEEGYVVTTAEDGLEALLLLHRTRVDLVVSVIEMPLVDGHDLVDELRETGNQTPVLLMNALGCPPCHHGAVRYLDMPFDRDELLSAVADYASSPPAIPGSAIQVVSVAGPTAARLAQTRARLKELESAAEACSERLCSSHRAIEKSRRLLARQRPKMRRP